MCSSTQFTGFDPEATGLLAAGGTISNLTALTAARERAIPGVRQRGTDGRRMALYCSAEAHHSVRRAAEVLGIGADNVRARAIDADRRMDVAGCAHAIDAAVDDPDALADVCGPRDVWLHVHGAYGLPAARARGARERFAGLVRADPPRSTRTSGSTCPSPAACSLCTTWRRWSGRDTCRDRAQSRPGPPARGPALGRRAL